MNTQIGSSKWKQDKLIEMRDAANEMLAEGCDTNTVKLNVSSHLAWWAPEGITYQDVHDMTDCVMMDFNEE